MESILEKMLFGGIGGLVAFWFANRKFISQRWWDKQFDLYIEAIDILKQIERSLATYEWALENGQTIDGSDIVKEASLAFEKGLCQLHGLQSEMMLIGLDEAHSKVMVLQAGLSAVHPSYLTSKTDEDIQQILGLIKQSKSMTGGCSGELALLGKNQLNHEWLFIKKVRKFLKVKFTHDTTNS